jgi:hypothetical protein
MTNLNLVSTAILMKAYSTVLEAVNDLKKRGYKEDFDLQSNSVTCAALNLKWHPENFKVDEFYRFEGMSNPDDNSIVFAISSNDGIKGTLVDAYGPYSENLTEAMIKKLTIKH